MLSPSKAKVLSTPDINGNPAGGQVKSYYDPNFVYATGETVEVTDFDDNRWNECSTGIHHFMTRAEAVIYDESAAPGVRDRGRAKGE